MHIKHWPEAERPREKLLLRGAQSLSDAELLAIFLNSGYRGTNAVELSRQMLKELNGLRNLLEQDSKIISQFKGLGKTKWVLLQAALELGRRYLETGLMRESVLHNPQETKRFVCAWLKSHKQEVFACLFLDNQHRIIAREQLFNGSINSANVYPREVVKRALYHNAAAVIFSHNHPSGVAEPSHADRQITLRLKEALALVDIRVIDHLIVGDTEAVSMAELGYI